MTNHQVEVDEGRRFQFGKNWTRFLGVLDEDRIREAERSLCEMLGVARLDGKTFIDVGSGSGLFSLAAYRLGASVYSFDYDPQSVATTMELRRRYAPGDARWQVESGSVLDPDFLTSLGRYDIVYSWGVLHHTGDMWRAMENVVPMVAPGGQLFIALYNDQGLISVFWSRVKRIYCSGLLGRIVVIPVFFLVFLFMGFLGDVIRWRNPFRRYTEYRRQRGMSKLHDWIDWLGGYPFDTANPGNVFDFYKRRGFVLTRLVTRYSLGCNEFVFQMPNHHRTQTHISDGVELPDVPNG